MAEKRYVAIFDARDQLSDKMKRMQQATDRARDAQGRFVKMTEQADRAQDRMRQSTNQAVNAMERMRRVAMMTGTGFATFGRNGFNAIKSVGGAVGGLINSLTSVKSLILSAGAAFGAWKLGDAVIGGAFRQEMAQTQMNALAGSEALGNDLYKMMRKEANNSIFSTTDYTQATRSYLGFSKDESELKEMLDVTKKLALWDPVQGFDGASFALKEAMSGDLISLAERFEMPKSMLRDNGFSSEGSYLENMRAVAKTLNAQNMTDKAVQDFENTGMGQYMEFRNKSTEWLGLMGDQAVEEMKPFFMKLNDFFGSESAIKFADDMSIKIGGLFDSITTGLSTISWNDIENGLASSGKMLKSIGETGLTLIDALSGSKGGSPVDIMRSFSDTLGTASEKLSAFNDDLRAMFDWMENSKFMSGAESVTNFFTGGDKEIEGRRKSVISWVSDGITEGDWSTRTYDGSHMGGLSYVPTDDYTAKLHQGERVLTASENRAYSKGSGEVLITGNTFHVRKESDINAIGNAIVMELMLKGGL